MLKFRRRISCSGLVRVVTSCCEVSKKPKTLNASLTFRAAAFRVFELGTPKTTMSESLTVCDVDEDLIEKLKKFRLRKETNNAAIVMKINREKQLVVLDEEHEDISPDDLKEELPERQPRFVAYSYKYQHDDGRVSYPLCFIFVSPVGCNPEQQMMYAGSKNRLVQTAQMTKVFEIRNTEDLTEEWLREKLRFFR
ncbi:glia maturation factor beta [Syngnathus typhle]|uniref:glia maturation factor beta n=1 Tax=Syngnathus typhle TaxID=161592 RepID=UPI002A6B51E9|nr:glia maturation factor beta [Syngnathus typhle]